MIDTRSGQGSVRLRIADSERLAAGIPQYSTILSFHHSDPPVPRGTRRKCAKQTQKAVVGSQLPVGGCKNEPNLVGSNARNKPNWLVWPAAPEGEIRKTNPISAVAAVESPTISNIPSFHHSNSTTGPGWDGAWGAWDARQMRKTNPICPCRAGTGGTDRAKQSQSPPESVGRGRPTYEERRAYRAKQTQFARQYRAGRGHRGEGRGQSCGTKPNLPGHGKARAPTGERCETNPIWPGLTEGRVPWRPTIRNKANLAGPTGRPIPGGKKCETNPIWPGLGRAGFPAGKRCETNPIRPRLTEGRVPWRSTMRNEACAK